MFFPMAQGRRFKKYESLVHPYSGLDPGAWKSFLLNIKTFEYYLGTREIDVAAKALYGAIENIRNLGLGIRRSDDTEYQEALDKIGNDLGYEGEYMLNQNAISLGVYFFPKYLNETIKDYPENVPREPFPRRRADS